MFSEIDFLKYTYIYFLKKIWLTTSGVYSADGNITLV